MHGQQLAPNLWHTKCQFKRPVPGRLAILRKDLRARERQGSWPVSARGGLRCVSPGPLAFGGTWRREAEWRGCSGEVEADGVQEGVDEGVGDAARLHGGAVDEWADED